LFLVALSCLAIAFWGLQLLRLLGYRQDYLDVLERLHFWGVVSVLAVFLLDLIWKLLVGSLIRGFKTVVRGFKVRKP